MPLASKTLTRLAALTAAAALLLSGCSATAPDGDEAAATADADSLLPAAEGKTEYPLTLASPWGETVLEERPERIAAVVVGGSDTELLAALGVTPVLAPAAVNNSIWTLKALPAEIEETYAYDPDAPYPLETIAAAEPDLIIVIGSVVDVGDSYDALTAIAPVLAGETTEQQTNANWQEKLKAIATALDLSDTAASFTSDYDDAFAAYQDEHPEFADKTVTFATYYGGESGTQYFSSTGSDVEAFFLSLGFSANPLAEEFVDNSSVSDELVSSLDADVLIVADYGAAADSESGIAELVESPLFEQLDAVQNDRYVLLTDDYDSDPQGYIYDGVAHEGNLAFALSWGGPLGLEWAAEQLTPILSEVLP